MQTIKDILHSWNIISPLEFFFGIAICIGIPLLLVSVAFKVFFLKNGSSQGRGWRYASIGVFACIFSTCGLVAVFAVPIFSAPDEVADWSLAIMTLGTLVGLLGLFALIVSVVLDIPSLLKPRGEQEVQWARNFIFLVPPCVGLAIFVQLYTLFDVK
jgi:hypothetical protein